MAASTAKVLAKISALDVSLDELEDKLEGLFARSLPESVVGLEKIQQAKLQVAIPYLVYDLVFIYLKTRGVDPRTHPVIAELDRVRQYFDKIKNAEDPAKRRLTVDKGVANRFIKHAIAQVQFGRPPGQDEGAAAEGSSIRVQPKVTSKMMARAQYEKELKELGSEEEEDLEVIDDADDSDAAVESEPSIKGKGKGRAVDAPVPEEPIAGQKRRRPQMDPFAGYGDETKPSERPSKSPKATPAASDIDTPGTSRSGTPQLASDPAKAKKRAAQKKARKKAKQAAAAAGS